MSETPGPDKPDRSPSKGKPRRQNAPSDPRKHAAELLEQADRLTLLAREMRREARRLNAALAIPVPQSTGSGRPAASPGSPAKARSGRREPARESRVSAASEVREPVLSRNDGAPDDLPISEGTRLMITNLATVGSSREEILGLMRDELGLEKADAILDRLTL
jgi:hypothetical protein